MPKSVQKAMKYNKESLEFIWSQVNGAEFKSSPRNNLVFAYGSVVLEHQKAIATLVESQLIGSAFALLRSQVEAVFRGLWSIQIATDKQVKDIGQNDAEPFPKF